MPGATMPLWNMFEYSNGVGYCQESMQQDIEKYGLYTAEDFADYLSTEEFNAIPIKYMKVAVGKGLLTEKDVIAFIEYAVSSLGDSNNSVTTQPTTTDGVETTLPPAVVTGDEDVVEEETTE